MAEMMKSLSELGELSITQTDDFTPTKDVDGFRFTVEQMVETSKFPGKWAIRCVPLPNAGYFFRCYDTRQDAERVMNNIASRDFNFMTYRVNFSCTANPITDIPLSSSIKSLP